MSARRHLRGSSPQHGTMALLGAFAGLRFGEVAALRRPSFDITSDAPIVHVRDALTEVSGVVSIGPPKTASSMRAVPIVGAPAARIYETVAAAEDDDLLFRSPNGGPISPTRWRARVWRRAVSFLEMKPSPTFHDLRHTYAAFLIEDGRHPKENQELMGHASIRTSLDVYGHLMEGVTHDRLAGLAARFGA